MKFVNDATAKDTAFIKCFPDDSGVYARVLTETELDTRYIIPHCVHSAIVVTMNARKLYRVFFSPPLLREGSVGNQGSCSGNACTLQKRVSSCV